ncbi:hypothetical protein BMF94_5073 [Rhodotorula taiwanensis]|uniref:J domain-containing protein n=1 Tax=Rhodotorula taiwanensis TaxID=741276 RepID=A0A2S5B4K2_9BASI|nr:hypothetical protein BMF94_5073 [Rhodotorula taiwanensis]
MATARSRAVLRSLRPSHPANLTSRFDAVIASTPRSNLVRRLPTAQPVRTLSQSIARHRIASSQTVYSTGGSCPGCGAPVPPKLSPVCPQCSALLPPPPPATTYYELFGVDPPSFAIDTANLKRSFLTMQQKVHPDMFSGQGESEGWAKAWSGRVNDAYKALINERERAEYLLSLHDVTIGEADPVTDPDLLMTIMETREELEEAQSEDDVVRIRDCNKEKRNRVIDSLATAFSASAPDLEAAKNLVIELRYLDNIEQVCREWQPGKRLELQH